MKRTTSLISTVYNEGDNIRSFLESIRAQTVLPDEIIIVDAASTDNTAGLIDGFISENKDLNLKLIREAKRVNIARGRNIAIFNARGAIIAVTDAGCVVDDRWFEEITSPFSKDNGIDIVSGWYEPLIETGFHRKAAEAIVPTLEEINPASFLPSSRSIAFKKVCWEKAGGYPEHLTLCGEDTLFDLRLKELSLRFVFNPDAKVFWRMRDSLKALLEQAYMYGLGDGEARIFTGRYCVRALMLLIPPLMVFTKKGYKHFWLRYLIYGAMVLGWKKGYLKKNT